MSNNLTSNNNDLLVFASEREVRKIDDENSWKILVVDDEMDVHKVTKLVLSGFEFSGKTLTMLSAYSAAQAKQILEKNADIAVVLLDVVMEEDDSGLQLVKVIREELKNSSVRIILRTGQPGQAPEQKVVLQYDINDYKAKTELTSEKLFTTVISSLRSYRDIVTIERSRRGLEKIIEASGSIFEVQSLEKFLSGILAQFVSLLDSGERTQGIKTSGVAASHIDEKVIIRSATVDFDSAVIGSDINGILTAEAVSVIKEALAAQKSMFSSRYFVGFFANKTGIENILFLERSESFEDWEKNIIEVLCSNVSIAFENIYLNQKLEDMVELRTAQLQEANKELSLKNANIMKELEMARRVQMSLMPSVFPSIDFVSFAGRYMPMLDLGGDYYDVFQIDKNRFGLVIADVSGHGASASLVTAMVKMYFNERIASQKQTSEIVTEIHQVLLKTVGHTGLFVTIFYGIIDLSSMTMQYTNAGHLPAMILGSDGSIRRVESNCTVVGVFETAEYVTQSVEIYSGDRIILFTDGISEALNAEGKMLGEEAVMSIVQGSTSRGVNAIADMMIARVVEHSTGCKIDDDRTILIAEIKK